MSEQPRNRLLDAVVAHASEHGLAGTSLRALASAVGTSHRMLRYHFGGREGLLLAVSQQVERDQRAAFAGLLADESLAPTDVMWAMYERLTHPTLAGPERLFFELYALALRGTPDADGLFPEAVDSWVASLTPLFLRLGFDAQAARDEARLALATARGLLLDLLATGDRAAVDRAMTRFVDRYA